MPPTIGELYIVTVSYLVKDIYSDNSLPELFAHAGDSPAALNFEDTERFAPATSKFEFGLKKEPKASLSDIEELNIIVVISITQYTFVPQQISRQSGH